MAGSGIRWQQQPVRCPCRKPGGNAATLAEGTAQACPCLLYTSGKIVTEEKEIEIPMFRPVKVFDVSQTDGKPLPELASSLSGNVPNYEAFMEALRRSAPVPDVYKRQVGIVIGTDGSRVYTVEGNSGDACKITICLLYTSHRSSRIPAYPVWRPAHPAWGIHPVPAPVLPAAGKK